MSAVGTGWKTKIANSISFTILGIALASIALSIEGDYRFAGILILIGYLLDALDGEVARRLGGSEFGTQLDSLVDISHFGIATAVLISQHLRTGPVGGWPIWLFLIVYMISASFRLARFNLAGSSHSKQTTTGLTISTSGAYLTLAVLADIGLGERFFSDWVFLPLLLVIAFLMASRITYPDLKGLLRYRAPFAATFIAGLLTALWLPIEFSMLGVWTVYVLFGTLRAALRVFV